jgi:hypothetical protein
LRRRGRLTESDRHFIADNADKMSATEIALHLNRSIELIKAHIVNFRVSDGVKEDGALKSSEAWRALKLEFTELELRYFEESYKKLIEQFKGDVLPSEETQIIQAVKFELLMSRNLKERRRLRIEIDRLEAEVNDFVSEHPVMEPEHRDYLLNLESQATAARVSEQNRTNEYVKLQERHEALMKSLKSTRDQRVKQIDNVKVDFLSVVKMLADREAQERESRRMELLRKAGETASRKLAKPHKYEDNNEDLPILSGD